MKKKYITCSLLAGTLVCAGLIHARADDTKDKQTKLEAQAKVSRADAEKTALAKVPGGKIQDAELEEEDGKLIWSFDVSTTSSKDITEVHVDAKTGKVVGVEKETPKDQAREKAADAKEKQNQTDKQN